LPLAEGKKEKGDGKREDAARGAVFRIGSRVKGREKKKREEGEGGCVGTHILPRFTNIRREKRREHRKPRIGGPERGERDPPPLSSRKKGEGEGFVYLPQTCEGEEGGKRRKGNNWAAIFFASPKGRKGGGKEKPNRLFSRQGRRKGGGGETLSGCLAERGKREKKKLQTSLCVFLGRGRRGGGSLEQRGERGKGMFRFLCEKGGKKEGEKKVPVDRHQRRKKKRKREVSCLFFIIPETEGEKKGEKTKQRSLFLSSFWEEKGRNNTGRVGADQHQEERKEGKRDTTLARCLAGRGEGSGARELVSTLKDPFIRGGERERGGTCPLKPL